MATLKIKKDRNLGTVAKLLRSKGWRTPVRMKSHSHGLLEGEVFLCIAHKDSLDAIPIEGGFPVSDAGPLSARERAALHRSGLRPADAKAVEESIKESTRAYLAVLGGSLSVEQAAAHLKVNESRIRQRLCGEPASLYGIKLAGGWRLPGFQFSEEGDLPGLGDVVGALDAELDPISVVRWFTSPNVDLVIEGDDAPWSPGDWLRGRRPAAVVVRLAKSL